MMETNGHLECSTIIEPFDVRRYMLSWVGGDYIQLDFRLIEAFVAGNSFDLNCGQVITLQNFRVRLLELDPLSNSWYAVRENWLGFPRLMSFRLRKVAGSISIRLLLTLYVWGLLERDPGVYPSWKDITVVKGVTRMKRWFYDRMTGRNRGDDVSGWRKWLPLILLIVFIGLAVWINYPSMIQP